jgi:hypothetical protein
VTTATSSPKHADDGERRHLAFVETIGDIIARVVPPPVS